MVRKWSGLLFCTGLISPEFELLYSIKSQSRDRLLREVILWLGTPSSPCLGWITMPNLVIFFPTRSLFYRESPKVPKLQSYEVTIFVIQQGTLVLLRSTWHPSPTAMQLWNWPRTEYGGRMMYVSISGDPICKPSGSSSGLDSAPGVCVFCSRKSPRWNDASYPEFGILPLIIPPSSAV